ncbi:MAG: hypothetical protein F4X57_06470 [Chloroflexi bacterium]|nr:hypothetical protein [Chloroflexota bacterium]
MREHEVPTHVQAEDRVLLWFTFPQIVAMTAVCALSYGAYRYAPIGPSEVRIAIAVLLGLVGLVAVVGRIGGRRLPLVAADLLTYRLGARLYAGQVSELVRDEPPTPIQQKGGPGPVRMMVRRAQRVLRRRRNRKRTGGRMPFRPHRWFGKRRREQADSINGRESRSRRDRRNRHPKLMAVAVAATLTALVASLPGVALADDHERWQDEIDFVLTDPVDGRRIFVEGLTVSGDRAEVTLRAATGIELRTRAFGGPEGTWLRFWGAATLAGGESIDYSLPLHGPVPSLTFSWVDSLRQAGAVTLTHEQIPFPLPEVEGELCDLRIVSLGWTPGTVSGVIESGCVTAIEHPVELQTVAGHASVTETTLMDAVITGITGTVSAAAGDSHATVVFAPDGEAHFSIPVAAGEAIHDVTVEADLEASLRIPVPPLTRLTHREAWTQQVTRTVHLHRPGASDSDSKRVSVRCEGGSRKSATARAYAHVPSATIARDVTADVFHPERVDAEVADRDPISRIRPESLSLASVVGSDDPFTALVLPEPEPVDPPAEQTPAGGGLRGWFGQLGWEWPW